jgi:hypothetical protein
MPKLFEGLDDEAAAVQAARDLLCKYPLFTDVTSWADISAESPKRRHRHALAVLACFLSDETLDGHFLIETLRKDVLPILQQSRPPVGGRGQHSSLNAARDRAIAETVRTISRERLLSLEQASRVVWLALKDLISHYTRAYKQLEKRKKADKEWLDQCRARIVDRLRIKADRVLFIAKHTRLRVE